MAWKEMFVYLLLVACGLLSTGWAQQKSYEGYKVIRTVPLDDAAVMALSDQGDWDFWYGPRRGQPADILASPEHLTRVQIFLEQHHIQYSVAVEDVQALLATERHLENLPPIPERSISFDRFHRLADIHGYLDELVVQFPNLTSVLDIGSSLEGRSLKLIKISSGDGSKPKPAIFIDAAIHAREWIAPPVALYTIQQLVENYTVHKALVDSVDWYILPVLNPDGYEYTHTTDRFWRKTRSFNGNQNCLGVDANRNFNFHWGELGSSNNPCSESYSGLSALSEKEAAALASFLLANHSGGIQLYLTLHSYGQLLLHPWGYTTDYPEDVQDLLIVGQAAAAAVQAVRGTKYTVGSSANVLYYSAGSSRDWAKGAAGIKYSYTMELPLGGSGFDPPPSAIVPVVTESFEAIKVFGSVVGGIKET